MMPHDHQMTQVPFIQLQATGSSLQPGGGWRRDGQARGTGLKNSKSEVSFEVSGLCITDATVSN